MDVVHYSFGYMGVLTGKVRCINVDAKLLYIYIINMQRIDIQVVLIFAGPYYRYRTYWDSLYRPFSEYVDPWPLTYYKLKQIAAFITLFLAINHLFPSDVMFIILHLKEANAILSHCDKMKFHGKQFESHGITNSFSSFTYHATVNRKTIKICRLYYPIANSQTIIIILIILTVFLFLFQYTQTIAFEEHCFLYRFFYMYPTFTGFRLRMFIGMALAECVCQMSGLGAYPISCQPTPGLGPRDYKTIEKL